MQGAGDEHSASPPPMSFAVPGRLYLRGRKRPEGDVVSNVIVVEWMSLDGVVQSAGADDDTTGGLAHGGWHLPYFDELSQNWVVEGYAADRPPMTTTGAIPATYARTDR
jgi:hypothetical protein